MGRNKDQKARRKNAPGIARNLARKAVAASDDVGGDDSGSKDRAVYPNIECPKCFSVPGDPCTTPSGKQAAKTHAARLK